MISTAAFYANYAGHELAHLRYLHKHLSPKSPIIWLAGDSTLDNKYWLPHETRSPQHPAPPQYTPHFNPPLARRDIAYWLNMLSPRAHPFSTINCAIEESTLRSRNRRLLPQDAFLAEKISSDDILIVSVGGNDIALAPTLRLALSAFAAVYIGGEAGMRALEELFVHGTKRYVQRLVARCKPRLVIICGLYFFDEARVRSWACLVLAVLLYNWRPARVKAALRRVFERVRAIEVEGVRIVAVPLYEALDGKDSGDYVARVEPSEQGGRKIARLLWDAIEGALARDGREGDGKGGGGKASASLDW